MRYIFEAGISYDPGGRKKTRRWNLTAREYLYQLKKLNGQINALILERELIKTLGEKMTPTLSERVQSSVGGDRIPDTVAKLIGLDEKINAKIDRLVDLKEEASKLIDALEDVRYRTVLSMYYLSDCTLEQVAEHMKMGFRWVQRLHKRALKEFENKFLN